MNKIDTPNQVVEVEIELDDTPEVEIPEKASTKKPSSKKKASAKKEKKPKEKKPPKPLTLHKNYLIDIRRHKVYLEISEDSWGHQLIVKETTMTQDGKKYKAITIAVADS